MSSLALLLSKSTQPTTPAINSYLDAKLNVNSVSATVSAAWTITVLVIFFCFISGSRSSGKKSLYKTFISGVIHE